MEYKHIVCPIDGSPVMDIGLEHAAYLCRATGARLTLLHVVEIWRRTVDAEAEPEEQQVIRNRWLEKGMALLDAQRQRLAGMGLAGVQAALKEGEAPHEIVALAVKERADLIVMATHRYSPTGKLFMGSVIDRVTRTSPCPIMWVF